MNGANEHQGGAGLGRSVAALALSLAGVVALTAVPVAWAAPGPAAAYRGLRDASAVVALDAEHFAVADDEDSFLRIYHFDGGAEPVWKLDVSGFLEQPRRRPESDIEAAARIGGQVYWITSHGTDAEGKAAPGRRRFFATVIETNGGSIQLRPMGCPCRSLLLDLAADERLARYGLLAAAALPPKAPGGLNIEGLGATLEGHLLIGFRNPIPDGKALMVRLLNPAELLDGRPARLGEPILLDLGGLGIRSIASAPPVYYLIAGPRDARAGSRLYKWQEDQSRASLEQLQCPPELNPEGVTLLADGRSRGLLAVSDDGGRKTGNKRGPRLKKPAEKSFRTAWIPLEWVPQ